MTEKVVLTKEQAKAIEKFQKTVHELGISLDELKVIFESGYEVKPEFKVGDWFVYIGKDSEFADDIKKGFTGQVESVHYGFITDGYHRFYNSEIRHATPEEIAEEKERRWWAEHGRKPWELKKGDVIIGHYTKYIHVISKDSDESGYYIEGYHCDVKEIKHNFKVLTFAENRLDVNNND